MTVVEWFESFLGSTNDPVFEIFGLGAAFLIVQTFFSGLFGGVFSFFK